MELAAKPSKNPDAHVIVSADGASVELEGMIHTLNETGMELFELCDGTRTVRDIVREMEGRYPEDYLETVIRDFLNDIHRLGIITVDTQ